MQTEILPIQQRLDELLHQLTKGIQERDQIMAVSLLAAISGQNTFLFGPPGTAKSLISRRVACAFEQNNYFEYLMNRFSTPEDVFGPVSIKALKEDQYIRKIQGYLPCADFAFLDEIWKSSPAILNNLLTIINEHLFKNGTQNIPVPLKSLIAASNEIPQENQGLEALYDRFIVRLVVPPIQQKNNFNKLLTGLPSSDKPDISADLKLRYDEISQWRSEILQVKLTTESLAVIHDIREKLAERFDEFGVYVSDRRWQRAVQLVKASAFCNGRQSVNLSDLMLLKYCLWTTPENQPLVAEVVMKSIQDIGLNMPINFVEIDLQKDKLQKEINNKLYYTEDEYRSVTIGKGRKRYFELSINKYVNGKLEKQNYYIPVKRPENMKSFLPFDFNGESINSLICQETGDNQFMTRVLPSYLTHYKEPENIYEPEILFKKGEKRQDVEQKVLNTIYHAISDNSRQLTLQLNALETKFDLYKKQAASLFVELTDIDFVVENINEQIKQLKNRIADFNYLVSLCY
ncbi:AAA family ATPase [Lonepinella sp. BR2930]|uniref:AAA family ATPase n=1 Tax=Lonepinella sp. BR2930 TaxID=3434554 RepID=UPI003F6DBBCE